MEISRRSFLKIVGITAAGTQVPLELMAAEDLPDEWDEWDDGWDPNEEYILPPRREQVIIEDDYPVKPGELVLRLDIDGDISYFKLEHSVNIGSGTVQYNALKDFNMTASKDLCIRTTHVMAGDFPYKWLDLGVNGVNVAADCDLTLQFDTGGIMRVV